MSSCPGVSSMNPFVDESSYSDNSEIEKPPPIGGYIWSDDDNDDAGPEEQARTVPEIEATSIIEIEDSKVLEKSSEKSEDITRDSTRYQLRSQKRQRYKSESEDSITNDAYRTSTTRKRIKKSFKPRMKYSKIADDYNETQNGFAKLEKQADAILRSCRQDLGDPSAGLFIPCLDSIYDETYIEEALAQIDGKSHFTKKRDLRETCPEWLLDVNCVQRPYSVVQLIVGQVLDSDARIVYAYTTANSNVKKVGRREYKLRKMTLHEYETSHWKMGIFPEALWRVRVGDSGALANLNIDQAVVADAGREEYFLRELTLRHNDVSGVDDKEQDETDLKNENKVIPKRSRVKRKLKHRHGTVERQRETSPEVTGEDESVTSRTLPQIDRPSISMESSKISTRVSSPIPFERSPLSTPPKGVSRGVRSVRFSTDTLTPENTSASQFIRSSNSSHPLQELLRETTSRKPIMSLSRYLRTHNMEIKHLAGLGGFGFVVAVLRIRHRVERLPSEMRVLKFVPIVDPEKDLANIIREVRVTRQLSKLGENAVVGYPKYFGCEYLQSRLPGQLQALLEKVPDTTFLTNEKLTKWLFIEMAYVGVSLECYRLSPDEEWALIDYRDAISIIGQLIVSLAAGEKSMKLEHRDCHWGNILINRVGSEDETIEIRFGQETKILYSRGIHLSLVDFGLVRCVLEDDRHRKTIHFVNLSQDIPEMFEQSGSLQYEVYRQMSEVIGDNWAGFHPRTNVLWIEYLVEKLLTDTNYKARNKKETFERQLLKRYLTDLRTRRAASATVCLQRFIDMI